MRSEEEIINILPRTGELIYRTVSQKGRGFGADGSLLGAGQRASQERESQEYLETLQGSENQRKRISLIFLRISSAKSRNTERRNNEAEKRVARLGVDRNRSHDIFGGNPVKRID